MNKLETLLNTLIQMGWKPWGKLVDKILYIDSNFMLVCLNAIGRPIRQIKQDSLRELVSLESGLWQFCVEKELIRGYDGEERKYTEIFPGDYRNYPADEHEYRLLESALIPEDELGKFLVDSIKMGGK